MFVAIYVGEKNRWQEKSRTLVGVLVEGEKKMGLVWCTWRTFIMLCVWTVDRQGRNTGEDSIRCVRILAKAQVLNCTAYAPYATFEIW